MSSVFEQYGLPLQPGEVGSRSYHSGGGPVPESSDGSLHPSVAIKPLSVETETNEQLSVPVDKITSVSVAVGRTAMPSEIKE